MSSIGKRVEIRSSSIGPQELHGAGWIVDELTK